MKTCIIFVCHSGDLECKSLLLLASIKKYLHMDYECVAAIPQSPHLSEIPQSVIEELERLGARLLYFENPYLQSGHKLIHLFANKMFAIKKLTTDCDRILFLDSDIVIQRHINGAFPFQSTFCARRAGYPNLKACRGRFEVLFQSIGKSIPKIRFATGPIDNPIVSPPFFNGGILGFAAHCKEDYIDAWHRNYDYLLNHDILGDIHFCEEVAIALAVYEMDIDFEIIVYENVFLHYHKPEVLFKHPQMSKFASEFIKDNEVLRNTCKNYPDWNSLL